MIINSPIVAALVGASFGLVLANLSSSHQAGPPRWALVGIFLAAVLAAVFVYNRLETIGRKVDHVRASTDLIRVEAHSGGMDTVLGLVQTCAVIRVVGRARQDQLSGPGSRQLSYLKATEAAVKSNRLRVYRRITGTELKPRFRDHLLRLFDNSRPEQLVQVAAVPNIDSLISYQIFDTTAALIGIETAPVPGVRDSTVVFLTYRDIIINALVAHFDSAWAGLDPTSTRADLEAETSSVD
jgi:hypothetical protein